MAQRQEDIPVENVGKSRDEQKFNSQWWKEKEDDAFKSVFGVVKNLEKRQSYRRARNIRHARLYGNLEVLGPYSSLFVPTQNDFLMQNRIALNVVKSCVNTSTSKIAKAKPRPLFLTEGGNYELQKKAKNLTKYLDGAFDDIGLYTEKQDSFRDGGVFGTGAVKFIKDKLRKKITVERVFIDEIIVDDFEAMLGKHRSLYQARPVHKDILKEMFPKYKDKIDAATIGIAEGSLSPLAQHMALVIEAWHLPSSPNAKDGRHVFAIETCTLGFEEWTMEKYPFVFDRWNKRLLGFDGEGLSEELTPLQIEINKILRRIQQSMDLFAIPRVALENGSNVNVSTLTNDVASIIKYSGTKPDFFTPQAMSPDVYNHLWALYQKSFEITGISQLSAASKKPEGLNSGVALREYQDIESDRFQMVGQRWELSFLEAASLHIMLTKELAEELGEDLEIKVSSEGTMEKIKWSEIDLDEEKYLMRVFPTSLLPTQPNGKLEKVTELVQSGFIEKEVAMDLLDFPDLEAATNVQLAPRKIIQKTIGRMIDKGDYESPEPYMNLDLALNITQYAYLNAKCDNVKEDRLELLRRYMDDCKNLKAKVLLAQAQAMAPQGPAVAGAPPPPQVIPPGAQGNAVPHQPPQSDILPVNQGA